MTRRAFHILRGVFHTSGRRVGRRSVLKISPRLVVAGGEETFVVREKCFRRVREMLPRPSPGRE